MTGFSRAWNYRCKNANRRLRRDLKNEINRRNRREGKRFLDEASVHKHNERDVT